MIDRANLVAAFERAFHHPPALLVSAPGRVNLLGEHVDYNDGVVLPVAIDRYVHLALSPVGENLLSLHAFDLKQRAVFSLQNLISNQDLQGRPLPNWTKYPAGIAWALQEAGLSVSGIQAVYSSTLPIGSGLSSSAAVQVAFAAGWRALGGWRVDVLGLAELCQRAENDYIGVASGLMDQFTSLCGVEGHALVLDTRSLDWYPIRLPEGTAIVVAASGVRRSLAGSAYNQRRAACQQAVELLGKFKPGLKSLREINTVEFAAYSQYLPEEVRLRAEHVVQEIARVGQAIVALKNGDAMRFGAIMFAGHRSLRDLYQVSIPELDALVEIARSLPGIYGARLTGAGFGGCTVNLIDAAQAEPFIQGLKSGYLEKTGRQAKVYLCRASAGVGVEKVQRTK